MIKRFLAHPLTRGLDIDHPSTTERRRQIIREKHFLKKIYQEWYTVIATAIPDSKEPVLELGTGAGFLSDVIPDLITSEVFFQPSIRVVLDGQQFPFANDSLRGIVMIDVLHHLPQCRSFFKEAVRCVRPGGCVAMVEPWVTAWSRLVYSKLHHEPFRPEANEWQFPSSGPLSGANGALPWIIFERDRTRFEREFPEFKIEFVELTMPFRYLVSGGVSMRALMPGWTFGLWRWLENRLRSQLGQLAMFAYVVLRKRNRVDKAL